MPRCRFVVLSFALCQLVVSAAFAQPKSAAAPMTWYSQAVSRGGGGINVTNFWSLGPKLRAETVVAGHKIITIVSGDTYYAFDAISLQGVAIARAAAAIAADAPERRPFGNEVETMIAQGAEKVREEVVMGAVCDVYQVTDDAGRRVLWASKDEFALPVRIEIYDRRTGAKKYTDFVDWLRGFPIAEEFFVPETSVALERYTLEKYVEETQTKGPVGPVPVLYADLLHGRRRD